MTLLKHLPDEAAFKGEAERGGRQTRAERVAEETLNESLRLRSVYEAVSSQGKVRWNPDEDGFTWIDPVDQVERDKQLAEDAAEREVADEDLYSDMGFT